MKKEPNASGKATDRFRPSASDPPDYQKRYFDLLQNVADIAAFAGPHTKRQIHDALHDLVDRSLFGERTSEATRDKAIDRDADKGIDR